jgi:hypothetical protein
MSVPSTTDGHCQQAQLQVCAPCAASSLHAQELHRPRLPLPALLQAAPLKLHASGSAAGLVLPQVQRAGAAAGQQLGLLLCAAPSGRQVLWGVRQSRLASAQPAGLLPLAAQKTPSALPSSSSAALQKHSPLTDAADPPLWHPHALLLHTCAGLTQPPGLLCQAAVWPRADQPHAAPQRPVALLPSAVQCHLR